VETGSARTCTWNCTATCTLLAIDRLGQLCAHASETAVM
jgi:hypothetical protein